MVAESKALKSYIVFLLPKQADILKSIGPDRSSSTN